MHAGCEFCYSLDGNWKLIFPHCLFPVKATLPGLPTLNMPNVCTEQLKPKSAFCVYITLKLLLTEVILQQSGNS